MYNYKAIQLLKSLSPQEIDDLEDFINSPFFYKSEIFGKHKPISRKKILQLYKILRKKYPDFFGSTLKDENIFKKLFPEEKFNEKKLSGLKHDLLRIIEIFLSYLDIQNDPVHPKMHLINQLEKRGLDSFLISEINKADDSIDKLIIKNEEYFIQKYQLSNKKWLLMDRSDYFGKNVNNFNNFQKAIEHSENSFLILMLKQLAMKYDFEHHINITIDTSFHDVIYDYVNKNLQKFSLNNVLMIWFKFISLHKDQLNDEEFNQLKNLLYQNETNFSRMDYMYLFDQLFNYVFNKYSKGDSKYKVILSSLLRESLNKKIHIHNNFINEHDYSGLVSIALDINEPKIAEEIIINYKDNLKPELRESVYLYNYGTYFFISKEYDKALELLSKINGLDFYYMVCIYNIQLIIFYEKKYFDHVYNLLDTYKHYLQSNKLIIEEGKIKYYNFIRFYEKLLKVTEGTSKLAKDDLLIELEKNKDIYYKNWLYIKIKELK